MKLAICEHTAHTGMLFSLFEPCSGEQVPQSAGRLHVRERDGSPTGTRHSAQPTSGRAGRED